VAGAVPVTDAWQYTSEVILERNCLNVVFVANDLHGQMALLGTAEFTVERNRLNVLCVTNDLWSHLTFKYMAEFTRERNLTSVHCVTEVSPSSAPCSFINVVYTATVDHIIVLTVESYLRQSLT